MKALWNIFSLAEHFPTTIFCYSALWPFFSLENHCVSLSSSSTQHGNHRTTYSLGYFLIRCYDFWEEINDIVRGKKAYRKMLENSLKILSSDGLVCHWSNLSKSCEFPLSSKIDCPMMKYWITVDLWTIPVSTAWVHLYVDFV